jgi:CxxC motif-containing protein
MEKKMVCTVCPMGCRLTVSQNAQGELVVQGNQCKRGERYGKDEFTDPKRTVTTSVYVRGGSMPVVSVRTKTPISKSRIGDVLRVLDGFVAQAPIAVGQVLIPNIAGSGADLVATRRIRKA